jgi:hypothetical protein
LLPLPRPPLQTSSLLHQFKPNTSSSARCRPPNNNSPAATMRLQSCLPDTTHVPIAQLPCIRVSPPRSHRPSPRTLLSHL